MILNLWDNIEKVSNNFKDWVIENNGPVLMIALFLTGLLVFGLSWNALHKNN